MEFIDLQEMERANAKLGVWAPAPIEHPWRRAARVAQGLLRYMRWGLVLGAQDDKRNDWRRD